MYTGIATCSFVVVELLQLYIHIFSLFLVTFTVVRLYVYIYVCTENKTLLTEMYLLVE